jgi:hypothetical protein
MGPAAIGTMTVIGICDMPDIEFIRAEIERTRLQVLRHRYCVMQLQRDGISSTSAEAGSVGCSIRSMTSAPNATD